MKTWLAKFKISTALDSGRKPKSPAKSSEELRRFEASLQSLDRRLKAAPVSENVPADLHASVWRAVQKAAAPQRTGWEWLRWLPAPALGLLLIGGVVWFLNRPGPQSNVASQPQPLTVASVTEQSRELTQVAPGAALAPLSNELERLNRDLQNAVKFLAASVP